MSIVSKLQTMGPLMPAATATPVVLAASPDGILFCYGLTEPTGAGYAPGCIFLDVDASTTQFLFINEGDATTATFKYVATGT